MDSSSEFNNRMIENCTRRFCIHNQDDLDSWLTTTEFAYNSANIEHLNISPFELDIGWKPESPLELHSQNVDLVNILKMGLSSAANDALFD